jgi:hypothetical protein
MLKALSSDEVRHWSAFPIRVEAPFVGVAPASNANSSPGTENLKEPQSKQTKDFAITKTPGLERYFRTEKWNIISVVNSASLADLHNTRTRSSVRTGGTAWYRLRSH